VGLVGLGAMGQGVARNLLRAGFEVHGCDVRAEALEAMVRAGGRAHATPAAVGAACDVLIVLVVNAEQTDEVLFGNEGAAMAMRPGSAVIASATTPPAFVAGLARRLEERSLLLLDAPVTGGVTGAADGTLSVLCSGSDRAYAACADVLHAMSARVHRFGTAPGLGSQVKVINQLLVGVQIAAAAEAMAFGMRQGVDPQLLYEAIRGGAGNSWAFSDRAPRMFSGDDSTHTALDIFVKDLGLVLEAARDASFPVPLATAAHRLFASASAAGLGRADDSAVIRVYPGTS
jgi:3-hydroxyisobutyrate dehydrogenase